MFGIWQRPNGLNTCFLLCEPAADFFLTIMSLQGGNFPQTGQQSFFRPFVNGKLVFAMQQQNGFFFLPPRFLLCFYRKFSGNSLPVPFTNRLQRAAQTFWLSIAQTYHSTQFHQRLVKIACPVCGENQSDFLFHGFLQAGAKISARLAVTREITRKTFPSTAGSIAPNAIEAMAPAV